MRRATLVAGTVLLLAAAGCIGSLTGSGGGEPLPPSETVLSEHRGVLEDAGSFTYVSQEAVEQAATGQKFLQNRTVRVDTESGRYLLTRDPAVGNLVRAYADGNGTTYRHVGNRTKTEPTDETASYYVNHTRLGPLMRNASFSSTGETTVEGVTVTEYVSTDTEGIGRTFFAGKESVTVESAEVHLYRTPEGLIKRVSILMNYTRKGQKVLFTQRVTIREVGNTTVRRPEWATGGRLTARRAADP